MKLFFVFVILVISTTGYWPGPHLVLDEIRWLTFSLLGSCLLAFVASFILLVSLKAHSLAFGMFVYTSIAFAIVGTFLLFVLKWVYFPYYSHKMLCLFAMGFPILGLISIPLTIPFWDWWGNRHK